VQDAIEVPQHGVIVRQTFGSREEIQHKMIRVYPSVEARAAKKIGVFATVYFPKFSQGVLNSVCVGLGLVTGKSVARV
jgi:hypothetical protein